MKRPKHHFSRLVTGRCAHRVFGLQVSHTGFSQIVHFRLEGAEHAKHSPMVSRDFLEDFCLGGIRVYEERKRV